MHLSKSRFVHQFQREHHYCLYHALTQQKVYGGPILNALFRAFDETCAVSDAINTLKGSYPESALEAVISDLFDKGLIVEDNKKDIEQYTNF